MSVIDEPSVLGNMEKVACFTNTEKGKTSFMAPLKLSSGTSSLCVCLKDIYHPNVYAGSSMSVPHL